MSEPDLFDLMDDDEFCPECDGEGGYYGEDIDRGYDFGFDPDAWYRCRTCHGKGLVHERRTGEGNEAAETGTRGEGG